MGASQLHVFSCSFLTVGLLEFLDGHSNLLLAIITAIYATLTFFLLKEAHHQRLQQVAPYVRVIFQKAPDMVLVENIGVGIASKVVLQGFTYKDQGEIWQCTFEPVYTVSPHEIAPVKFLIELPRREGQPVLDHRAIFQMAFRHAASPLSGVPLVLNLYSEDVLRNRYKSHVHVDGQDLFMFLEHAKEQRWTPVTLPPTRERRRLPDTVPPRQG